MAVLIMAWLFRETRLVPVRAPCGDSSLRSEWQFICTIRKISAKPFSTGWVQWS